MNEVMMRFSFAFAALVVGAALAGAQENIPTFQKYN